jgi:hypothetical protein
VTVTHTSLGLEFARAFGARDRQRIRELVGPDVDFMALTPRRTWQATGPDALLEILLGTWITDADEIQGIEKLEHDKFEDRERVGYRFRVANTKGEYVVEQQAYVTERDGRIGWMRVVCSGWRRSTAPE